MLDIVDADAAVFFVLPDGAERVVFVGSVIALDLEVETGGCQFLGKRKEGGGVVWLVGDGPAGKETLYRRIDGELSGRPVFDAAAALLPGFAKPPQFAF